MLVLIFDVWSGGSAIFGDEDGVMMVGRPLMMGIEEAEGVF